jgi:hypothetical protein
MVESLLTHMVADDVEKFVAQQFTSEGRPDFKPAIPLEKVEAIIRGLIWLMNSRPSDTASMYAFANLSAAVGLTMAEAMVADCKWQQRSPSPTKTGEGE